MKGTTESQEKYSCQMARDVFERTVLEEPVSPKEDASFKEHLSACEKCNRLYRVTNAFPQLTQEAAEVDFDADIDLVLQTLDTERKQTRGRMRWGLLFAAAAIPLVAILLGKTVFNTAAPPPKEHVANTICLAATPVELAPGVLMTHCEGNQLSTQKRDGAIEVTLHQGTVALSVNPNRPNRKRVSVLVPAGEVRVKGTLFSVSAGDSWDNRVDVFRGKVAVIPRNADRAPFDVSSGHGAKIEQVSTFELFAPKSAVLIERLNEMRFGDEGTMPAIDSKLQNNSQISLADSTPVLLDTDKDTLIAGRSKKPNTRSNPTAGRSAKAAEMNVLVEDARACLLTQDWHCAAAKYRNVIEKYANSPESNAVLISLAKIELRHLNKPHHALKHYNQYLARLHDGPLAEEAMLGVANSYRRLKQHEKEKQVLLRYVHKYPGSALTEKATRRLKHLSDSAVSNP